MSVSSDRATLPRNCIPMSSTSGSVSSSGSISGSIGRKSSMATNFSLSPSGAKWVMAGSRTPGGAPVSGSGRRRYLRCGAPSSMASAQAAVASLSGSRHSSSPSSGLPSSTISSSLSSSPAAAGAASPSTSRTTATIPVRPKGLLSSWHCSRTCLLLSRKCSSCSERDSSGVTPARTFTPSGPMGIVMMKHWSRGTALQISLPCANVCCFSPTHMSIHATSPLSTGARASNTTVWSHTGWRVSSDTRVMPTWSPLRIFTKADGGFGSRSSASSSSSSPSLSSSSFGSKSGRL
mmetsp:Transcript_14741/g.34509  ORF Transcript_14741/g.34509 Transcript_14741/m.34509 type:complete len:292 (+) Transcript_14741:724-1599(+)